MWKYSDRGATAPLPPAWSFHVTAEQSLGTGRSQFSHTIVAYGVLARIIIVFLGIIVAVLSLVLIVYITWLYRQGSFPVSRLRTNAKRAARRTRQLDHEDNEHEPEGDS